MIARTLGKAALALALFATPALAQQSVPDTLPYQGSLLQSDGIAYDGTVSLYFRIYESADAAQPVWQEEVQGVEVSNGKFSVYLGNISSIVDYVSDARTRYMGISVNGGAEAAPRQKIASVPFALYSRNAAYLGGQPADTFVTIVDLDARGYTDEQRVIELIGLHAGGGGEGGVNEARVIELINENAVDAGVNEARVIELINQFGGLSEDEVNVLIDARNYQSVDAINALIDARNYLDTDAVNALIDARNYLNEAQIQALIDASVAAAIAGLQVQIDNLANQVNNFEANGGGLVGYILGVSNSTTTGLVNFNGQTGLRGAEAMCQASYAGEATAHLCTQAEVERAVATEGWSNNPNFNNQTTWTMGASPTTGAAFNGSLGNTCQNMMYNSGDIARGTVLSINLNLNPANRGTTGPAFNVSQNIGCGGNHPVLCCR